MRRALRCAKTKATHHEVCLVQQHHVREGHLRGRLAARLRQLAQEVLRVHQAHNAVERGAGLHRVVGPERLRDRPRVCEACAARQRLGERLVVLDG
jgi:hypothetical protein